MERLFTSVQSCNSWSSVCLPRCVGDASDGEVSALGSLGAIYRSLGEVCAVAEQLLLALPPLPSNKAITNV